MPTITIHKPADLQIVVIDGEPPIDQSGTVALLQARVAALEVERDALTVQRDTAIVERNSIQARFAAFNVAIDAVQAQA